MLQRRLEAWEVYENTPASTRFAVAIWARCAPIANFKFNSASSPFVPV